DELLRTREGLAASARAVAARIAAGVDQALEAARRDVDLERVEIAEARRELLHDRDALASDRKQLEKDRLAVEERAAAAVASAGAWARGALEEERARLEQERAELAQMAQRALTSREVELARERQALQDAQAEIPLQVSAAIEAALRSERAALKTRTVEFESREA